MDRERTDDGRQAGRHESVHALIATRQAELDELADVLVALRKAAGLTAAAPTRAAARRKPATSTKRSRAAPVAPGSVPSRVLEILGEAKGPMRAREICAAKTGAKDHHVMAALRDLVRGGRVVKRGATLSLRYMLPQFDTAASEDA